MKLVTAIINESKLDEVREALLSADITRITVVRVSGHGQQKNTDIYRGTQVVPNLIPKVKVEIAVNEEFVNITVDTIIEAARSGTEGSVGDGKIFITNLEQCIRIRTGEKGGQAI
ncbi:MAG: P-II family nitrogen regulator [Bacteroidales bacterium]|nr:P-II family nitrogen regulator [Bacteroidales bacterium]MBN2819978.1 P-II family nitrogen regulator [Bacteroidales bacterium]